MSVPKGQLIQNHKIGSKKSRPGRNVFVEKEGQGQRSACRGREV